MQAPNLLFPFAPGAAPSNTIDPASLAANQQLENAKSLQRGQAGAAYSQTNHGLLAMPHIQNEE